MRRLLRLAPLALALGVSGCLEKKVELALTLPKTRWEEGEFLWYKLEVKNTGWGSVTVDDPFWFSQHQILANERESRGTYFIIRDAHGNRLAQTSTPFGFHGELRLWANDCGGGRPCATRDAHPVVLRGGQSLVATPSIVAAMRSNTGDDADVRGVPRGAKAISDSDRKAMAAEAESLFLFGDPRRAVDASEAKRQAPPGYRILDTTWLLDRGRYTIQAVFDQKYGLPPVSAEEELSRPGWCTNPREEVCRILADKVRSDWAQKSPSELVELRRLRAEFEARNEKLLRVSSVPVEFEVVAGANPGPALTSGMGHSPSRAIAPTPGLGRTLSQSK